MTTETGPSGMVRLPDVPSELLALALDDLEAVNADPLYEIDMWIWHIPRGYNHEKHTYTYCAVCFAGAVMAKTLNVPYDQSAMNDQFDKDTNNKLVGINSFRSNNVARAVREITNNYAASPTLNDLEKTVGVPPDVDEDFTGFVAHQRRVVEELKAVGL